MFYFSIKPQNNIKWVHRILVFTILFTSPVPLLSQQDEGFVSGVVLDARTGAPVAFSTIRLKEKAIGVISNQDGSFRIPGRFLRMGEILEISCLGYQSMELSLSNLKPGAENAIRLIPAAIQLDESVLYGKRKRPPAPRKIIKRALERIPQNYPTTPFGYVGYYRDYQMKGKDYINLNEALLKVADMGFGTNDLAETKIQVYQYRTNPDFKRDTTADNSYNYATREKIIKNAYLSALGGNELNILRIHDAIRNHDVETYSYIHVPEKGLIRNHSLLRKKDRIINGDRVFVIGLEKNKPAMNPDEAPDASKTSRFTAEGTIYISQSTYAIHKLEYRVLDTKSKEPKGSETDASGKPIFEVSVEYMEHNGKMYPNYISFHNVFTLKKAPFRVTGITMDRKKKCFDVDFNRKPILFVDREVGNFQVRYKRKKIALEKTVHTFRGYQLFPEPEKFDEIASELTTLYGDLQSFPPDLLEIYFTGIKDIDGNGLNEVYEEEYNQFREFFTQQVQAEAQWDIPENSLMKKDRPLFDNQPVKRPDNFDDFWMNTPLKARE